MFGGWAGYVVEVQNSSEGYIDSRFGSWSGARSWQLAFGQKSLFQPISQARCSLVSGLLGSRQIRISPVDAYIVAFTTQYGLGFRAHDLVGQATGLSRFGNHLLADGVGRNGARFTEKYLYGVWLLIRRLYIERNVAYRPSRYLQFVE